MRRLPGPHRSDSRDWCSSRPLLALTCTACLAIVSLAAPVPVATAEPVTLDVAVYEWLPQPGWAAWRLERDFEAANPQIDLRVDLWSPYDDETLGRISDYDVAEIDLYAIGGLAGKLDKLPGDLVADDVIPEAAALQKAHGEYVVLHWLCGNFLVGWSDNDALREARTFVELLAALDPEAGRPLLMDMGGTGTLGGYYADALIDQRGANWVRQHLMHLTGKDVSPYAVDAVVRMAREMLREQFQYREHFHDYAPRVYPQTFARYPLGALVGYSEGAFHVQAERQLMPPATSKLAADDIFARQIPFAGNMQGMPVWADGYVVPTGKLASKQDAIRAFLGYAVSAAAYSVQEAPGKYTPSCYLLPARAAGYDASVLEKQPAIPHYRDALVGELLFVDDPQIRAGMKLAGGHVSRALGEVQAMH